MPDKQPRKWQSKGFIPFRLEVLTPVFIGSGTTLSPLEYVIRKEDGKARLYRIDLQSWLMEYASDQSVQKIIASGEVARIRRMLDEKVDAATFAISSSIIEDNMLADELKQAFGGQQTRGSFQKDKTGDVDAALRNPVDSCLYIPGSSLKGAISTPLINWLDDPVRNRGQLSLRDAAEKDRCGMQNLLEGMFGSISEHAMQALKVSDVAAPFSAGAVVRARERSLKPEKKGTPKAPCEAIMPGSGEMWGRLLLDSGSGTPAITLRGGTKVSLPDLVRHCNTFYRKRFEDEMDKFYQLPHFKETQTALRGAETKVKAGLEANSMLLRVGHYSHVECVTIENNQPRTRKGKNGTPMYGTTRTLANGRLPFGWVVLHFCSPEDYEEGMREAETRRRAAVAEQAERLLKRRREAEAKAAQQVLLLRQQEERRLAAEQKAAEEQKKREDLARRMAELSPEEARLLKLKAEPCEALSMEIFKEMKGWNPELRRRAAEVLRDCWTELGKWNGKQSKKQEAKVREVKALLD